MIKPFILNLLCGGEGAATSTLIKSCSHNELPRLSSAQTRLWMLLPASSQALSHLGIHRAGFLLAWEEGQHRGPGEGQHGLHHRGDGALGSPHR